jgi:uncharacterized protein (TIGR03437 family)
MRLLTILILASGFIAAQPQCQFYLANQTSSSQGLALHLDAQADSKGMCALNSVNITLTVGDGTGYHHISVNPAWQTGVYTAKAIITAGGPQQLLLNGQSLGNVQAVFKPSPGAFSGSSVADSATANPAYMISEISLQVSNGSNNLSIAPNGNDPIPLPLVLMAEGGTLWSAPFTEDPAQTTTVTATFRFDPAVSNPHQFDPYVDAYGQSTYASWPSKVKTDSDLQAALNEEQTWLANYGPLGGLDLYGGSTLAGWTDKATGYYHTAQHNNRWWLISPLGNPLFYIGLDTISGYYYTPVTGRESMFTQLPPQTGDFAAAYSKNIWNDSEDTTYVSFAIANQVRKYGSGWRDADSAVALQRIFSWGFTGAGKWTSVRPDLALNPVLMHSAVTNVVTGGHPDVFDPSIVAKLKSSLTSQIGANITNPYIIGWSVGNEKDEIITASEVQSILALGASVPVKMKLVDEALSAIYSGSVSALAAAWNITASTAADVYAAKPTPPSNDVESLRQYYEQNYYSTLYQTVKAIDPNHLYLGNWMLLRIFPLDWPIIANNCDVIGFDFYSETFLDPAVQALIQGTNKPVLIGEFSFPSDYSGLRGFGSQIYNATLADSASGDLYAQWLRDTSANPFVIGVEWFENRDEPVSGRGNNNGIGNISSRLVLGENYAFGMVDVTDRPKYDLINKVRTANIVTLQGLGLLGPGTAPQINSGGIVIHAGTSATVSPGSIVDIYGTNLAAAAVNAPAGANLPTTLGGSQVMVNGTAAPLIYVGPQQIVFQMPYETPLGAAPVMVVNNNVASAAAPVTVQPAAPFILTYGNNRAVVVNQDGSVNASGNGDKPGNVLVAYLIGSGPLDNAIATGAAAPLSPLSQEKLATSLTIGGVNATVQFAGMTPRSAGLMQVNFVMPSIAPGDYALQVKIGSNTSNQPLITVAP